MLSKADLISVLKLETLEELSNGLTIVYVCSVVVQYVLEKDRERQKESEGGREGGIKDEGEVGVSIRPVPSLMGKYGLFSSLRLGR